MPAPLTSKRKLFFEWFAMSDAERFKAGLPINSMGLRKYLHISDTTGKKWEKEYFDQRTRQVMEKVAAKVHGEEEAECPPEETYDSQEWLNGRTQKADEALIRACEQGNAQALKIYYQLTKRLIEKQEVIHKLDGDFIARQILEAERELRKGNYLLIEGGS